MAREGRLSVAVTMGDPRGIGPEVILKAFAGGRLPAEAAILVVGSRGVLAHEARLVGLPFRLPTVAGPEDVEPGMAGLLDLDNFPLDAIEPRAPGAEAGRASVAYVETAVRLALAGRADAVVTGPISKEAIGAAGSPFPGHTEMLAHLTGVDRSAMLMVCPYLRTVLVTTHLALRDVPDAVTTDGIVATTHILADGLRRFFGLDAPRIAVCGLNPHCGDGGRFGDEEARVIAPAVERLRAEGTDARGPLPADTAFAEAMHGDYDAVVAMYHDQALIPVKLAGLRNVVNVTLGLPIIRTSVGHGTAFGIAGRGVADEGSLVAAVDLAVRMARAGRPRA